MKALKGIGLNVVIAVISILLYGTEINKTLHISSLLYAIIIGMIISNFTSYATKTEFQPGIAFTSKKILRLGVILLGFKLSLAELTKLGVSGVLFIGVMIIITVISVMKISEKFGLSEKMGICLAAGTAICGASAVAAVGPIIEAEEEDTAFGIGAITLFGTIAMFIFPALYRMYNLNDIFYGAWVGITLPEVAEVVAAGGAVGSDVAESMAILSKLTRVVFLVPVSIGFTIWQSKRRQSESNKKIDKPYYVLGFILVVILNSVNVLSPEIKKMILNFGNIVLTTAMASLGLKTNIKKMMKAGVKPLIVGLIGMVIIQILGFTGAYYLF